MPAIDVKWHPPSVQMQQLQRPPVTFHLLAGIKHRHSRLSPRKFYDHDDPILGLALSIEAILQRLAQGEQRAFAELVDLYQHPLFGFLGRLGLGQAQAEDIAQETFLRAWTHWPDFQPERAQFATWLFTIARNRAYNVLQSASQQREITGQELPDLACPQSGPAQLLDRAQQQARLQNALRQLPMKERSALALVYVHELGLADVARIEGDSLPAIKTRLHRAKQRLRDLLQPATPPETFHE